MDIWSAMWRDLTRRRDKAKMEGSYILGLLIYLSLLRGSTGSNLSTGLTAARELWLYIIELLSNHIPRIYQYSNIIIRSDALKTVLLK